MTDNSPAFHALVYDNFQRLANCALVFVTAVEPDALYAAYLAAFPEGTNPIFRKNPEHECSTCRQFIRRAGGAVTVDSKGLVRTCWDDAADKAPYPYNVVAAALRDLLRGSPIMNLYRVLPKEVSFGSKQTRSLDENGQIVRWNHLHSGEIPDALRVASPGSVLGEYRALVQVFQRGLVELHPEAVSTVLQLIDAKNLYRGEEHRHAVAEFQKAQLAYQKLDEAGRQVFPWTHAHGKFRNSAIGKLVDDLSGGIVLKDEKKVEHTYHPDRLLRTEGGEVTARDLASSWESGERKYNIVEAVRNWLGWDEIDLYEIHEVKVLAPMSDVEGAVRAFEKMVAPENYKRTSAIITPGMVQQAMNTIAELELELALERRLARIEDISVNDVKWVDGSARPLMRGGLGDVLMKHAVASSPKRADKDEENAEQIGLDDFVTTILPKTTGLELLLRNNHLGNLVVLTAPVHQEFRRLFKWDNDFAWSYSNNLADSTLRQAVQSRGGRVDGVFRFSHSWNHRKRNASLMDLHVFMPGCGVKYTPPGTIHDNYGKNDQRVGWNHRNHGASGGTQDVDYTAAAPEGYVPVENITFPDLRRMPEGQYVCKIHNWNFRPPTDGGFKAEIEFGGQVFAYEYDKPLSNKEWVTVATVTLKDGVFSIEHHIPYGTVLQEKWGLTTESYVKVSAVTLSPNHWGESRTGNRHTFFFLDGAKCDEPMRGIYNEFLDSRLEPHRKVFEVVGDKTKCQPVDGQLAGVGFSSTKRDSFVVRAQYEKRWKLYNIQVGA